VDLPVMPPVRPMLAKAVPEAPAGDMIFEPKWDGFRCIIFRDGDEVELGSRNERPLTRYFPEVLPPVRAQLPERCVVDCELIVAKGDKLDFDALQLRLHPAASRVNLLAGEIPAEVVLFDILALGDRDLRAEPFGERRRILESVAAGVEPPIHLTPVTTDRAVAADWFERFEGAGLDGLIVKPVDQPYVEDKRTQFKLKHVRTADVVVAGYRVHKDGKGIGSLLLGLFDDDGRLHHVGVAASFTAKFRTELRAELEPMADFELAEHPWADWLNAEAHADGRMPGGFSRWNAQKDLRWVPIRADRVAEVKYESVLNGRFRATTRFVRWRPDRTPESCTYGQLEEVEPVPLSTVLGA
jgi:ATP-dependent DNA ligase